MSLLGWVVWISISLGILALIRNQWVYAKRIDVLHRSSEAFYSLPTYNQMMVRFWVWNIDRFLPPAPDVRDRPDDDRPARW